MAVKIEKGKKLKIRLKKSLIGRTRKIRAIAKSLGLGKVNSVVFQVDRPEIQGMIKKIDFLLEVEEQ